jgi:N-acetylmuramoyl-L-alanine amidase
MLQVHLLKLHFIPIHLLLLSGILFLASSEEKEGPLDGKIICLDPGHGGTADTDQYRVGPSGEREEWVNLRVAFYLREKLEASGAKVVLTREEDIHVPLDKRSEIAHKSKADLFLSIHHNATADTSVNFPIVYFHGSANENQSGLKLAKLLSRSFRDLLFEGSGPVSVVSDFTIFPNSGTSVLRGTYGIPGVVAEASFFSNAQEEDKLKKVEYNELEAEAYYWAIAAYFEQYPAVSISEKVEPLAIPVFPVFQEADRMNPEALNWKENVIWGKELYGKGQLDKAFEKFTLSIKSFPDSYLAREAHEYRLKILEKKQLENVARLERKRLSAYYPSI